MREVFYGVISQGVTPYFFMMEFDKICSFFGHRDVTVTQELYEATFHAIVHSLKNGCRIFYFKGNGKFDDLCYRIVTMIKSLL